LFITRQESLTLVAFGFADRFILLTPSTRCVMLSH
jgi:hypothetical protein